MAKPINVITQNKTVLDVESMLKLFVDVAYKYKPNINKQTIPNNFNNNFPEFIFLFKFNTSANTNMNGNV